MDHLSVGLGSPMRWRHQWRNMLAPGVVTAPSAPLTNATGASGSQPGKDFLELQLFWTNILMNTQGHCRQLKTAKVTRVTNSRINIGYNEQHRVAPTAKLHGSLAHDIGHVIRTHCSMKWKSWKVMPEEMRTAMCGQLLAYVNRLFVKRYKQWKSDLHHHFQAFDDPQNKAKVNKGNRNKKTLLHHSSSRPFSYRMDGGSKFPAIDVFGDIYVRPGMSWPSPFIGFFKSPPPNFLPILRSILWILHRMRGFRS
ncbi:unnamed protein product [Prunus brigantina]